MLIINEKERSIVLCGKLQIGNNLVVVTLHKGYSNLQIYQNNTDHEKSIITLINKCIMII